MLAAGMAKPLHPGHRVRAPPTHAFMNRIARLAAFALVLLLLFLAALTITQSWLKSHTERVRRETIAAKQAQLDQAIALLPEGRSLDDDDTRKTVGTLLGATIVVSPETGDAARQPAKKTSAAGRWEFSRPLPADTGQPPRELRVKFTPPAVVYLLSLYQQCAVLLLFLALGLLLVMIVAVVFSLRARSLEQSREGPSLSAEAEINSLTHLAKVSARQSTELERERIERQRAEDDAHFQQMLLNRALEEKIRLGHDLHDGIIQSLYAAGLTVEAGKNLIERDPAEATRQLETGVKTINTTIREVRSYISGLSPESLRQQSFADAVRSLTRTLDAGRAATYDVRIDDDAAQNLSDDQSTHLLQIAREAVSNGLRHGGASAITVRFHQSDGALCLLVQDNGRGFAPTTTSGGGHGLGNMRARAERIGGKLQFSSSPGTGTKLIVTFPATTPSVS